MTITETFKQALAHAEAALPALPVTEPGRVVSADELQALASSPHWAAKRHIADEIVAVLGVIQGLRDNYDTLDRFLRDRGLITRARTVRP